MSAKGLFKVSVTRVQYVHKYLQYRAIFFVSYLEILALNDTITC